VSIAVPSSIQLVSKDGPIGTSGREDGELTITGEHVLRMLGVTTSPGFVGDFINFSAPVVSLVECYGD
jgi:hypothetical protein